MTEFDLKNEVSKFYTGYITLDKAIKLYELEYGIIPEIDEDTSKIVVNPNIVNLPGYEDFMTVEHYVYMKKLQESGEVNMFSSAVVVQQNLLLSIKEAKKVVVFYMKNYQMLYFPEQLV